jgi:Protein of unknown function (DUF1559)
MQCANNLHQIALALHNYSDVCSAGYGSGQKLPAFPAGTVPNPKRTADDRLSWCVALLPYLEQEELSRTIDYTAGWNAPTNASAMQTALRVFQCSDWMREADPESSLTAYLGMAGVGADAPLQATGSSRTGIFGYDRRTTLASVKDGLANTILILESARDNGPWARGGPSTVRALDPSEKPYLGSGHPFGGTHFAENILFRRGKSIGCNATMADGSVRFLQETIADEVLEALATISGGERIDDEW